jgi:hypothetical protein
MDALKDLTIIYLTAGILPESFATHVRNQLKEAAHGLEIVSMFQDPSIPRSQAQIYRQALAGARMAHTKYVAIAEDDVLYSGEHFKFRPKDKHWGYNMNAWNIYTWGEPVFSYKAPGGRRNLNGLICERDLLIEHLEERFSLWPGEVDINIFGEPGKYDNQLGTTPYPSQDFYCNPPNIVFSHQANLQFEGLGTRKALGQIRATAIPTWGTAKEIRKLYV